MSDDELVQVPRREWEAMKARMARLEQRAEPDRRVARPSTTDGRTDRRGVLRHGAMLAAAAAAGGTALVATQAAPASATTGAMQFGAANDAAFDTTFLSSESSQATLELINYGSGAALEATDGPAGKGAPLVVKVENTANLSTALTVSSVGSGPAMTAAVTNASSTANALSGITNGTGSAVAGQITNGASAAHAVSGVTNGTGAGVFGQISNAASTFPAVTGVHSGPGAALGGVATGVGPAIEGLVYGGTGQAIVCGIANAANTQPAISTSTNGTGPAIQGQAASGRGAVLAGGAAQVQLVPSVASTHPTSGQAGDLFVDKSARLWFCKVGGSSATWGQIQVA